MWHFFLEFNFGLFDEFSDKRISLSGKKESFPLHPALYLLLEGLSELVWLCFEIFDFPVCNIEFARAPLVSQRTNILIPRLAFVLRFCVGLVPMVLFVLSVELLLDRLEQFFFPIMLLRPLCVETRD